MVLRTSLAFLILDDGDDADLSVAFEYSSFDLGKVFQALVASHVHHIVVLDSHVAERVRTPLPMFKQNQWYTIKELGNAIRAES